MRIDLSTRQAELALARAIAMLRLDLRMTQRELAERAGMSQSAIARIESGVVTRLPLAAYLAVFEALGVRPRFELDAPFVDRPRRQADRVHALCSGYVRRRLESHGWLVAQEVLIGSERYVGWIDILAFHPPTSTAHIQEIKTRLPDIGQAQRSLGWYEREAWRAANGLGWRPRQVTSAMLVLASQENEATIRANRELLAQWLPLRAAALIERIRNCPPSWSRDERGLALIDPRDRRTTWLRPTSLEGRRTACPYADYRDAAGR